MSIELLEDELIPTLLMAAGDEDDDDELDADELDLDDEELDLDESVFGHDALFPVHALTAGISYDVMVTGSTKIALGSQFSMYHPDKRLSTLYGDNPFAGEVYLRIYPRAAGQRSGVFYLPY